MNSYGLLLLAQTLLALLALAMCGAWAIMPFRRDDRPHLWLAAPLAGLLTLGGCVAAFYLVAAWPFSRCLWLGFVLNAFATVACTIRTKPSLPSRRQITVGVATVLVATIWAHFVCNRTAIEQREPTLTYVHNNDMFNYAIIGEWMQSHLVTDPATPEIQVDFIPQWHLKHAGSRPVTFSLLAAASEVRGTPALFTFDWFAGIVLSAAVIAFGGLFASNSLLLALLVAGASVSSWPTECRTAFLGKSIAYPGAMLLSALALEVLSRANWVRILIVALLGAAVGFALNPIFTLPVLGAVLGGYAGFTAVLYLVERVRGVPSMRLWPDALRPMCAAVLLWALITLPAVALHQLFFHFEAPPVPPAKWSVVIPVSLDLELPTIPAVLAGTRNATLWGTAALLALMLAIAARQGNRSALALLSCVLAIPAARLAGDYRLHAFQGIFYPLTLAGAALLASSAVSTRRVAVFTVVIVLMIGLRLPQHLAAGRFYFYGDEFSAVLRQSEVEAVRATIASDAVDVALPYFPDNHFAMSELLAHGTRVQLQGLAWQRTLGVYHSQLEPHNLTAPKARFSLVDREQWSPPGSERWVGSRWKLIEDEQTVSMLSVNRPLEFIRFQPDLSGVWLTGGGKPAEGSGSTHLDKAPVEFLIHNGTRHAATIRLHATLIQHPSRRGQRDMLRARLDTEVTSLMMTKDEMQGELTLNLKPGLNRVTLWAEAAGSSLPTTTPLIGFGDWKIEQMTNAAKE